MTSPPILTIAIPTFNRHEKLKFLFDSFLLEVSSLYFGQVEIIVCDNSDKSIAEKNRELLESADIVYKKNTENIGYSGNIIKCINEARGFFLWVISDDDHVWLSEFTNLMQLIPSFIEQEVGCVMLPYATTDVFGRKHLRNSNSQWGVVDHSTLRKMMENNNQLPFVLFSGAIISKKNYTREKVEKVEEIFGDNDFIQIPLFMDTITLDAQVVFHPGALQEYKVADTIRFNLEKMHSSMMDVITYYLISDTTLYRKYLRRNYKMWLGWFLWDRSGLVGVPGARSFRYQLASNIMSCISFKNIILTILMYAPSVILRIGYASYAVVTIAIRERQLNFYKMWKGFAFYTKKLKH
jgi:hypothetical protein